VIRTPSREQSHGSGDSSWLSFDDAGRMPQASDDTHHDKASHEFEVCLRGVLTDGIIAELGARRESPNTTVVIQASDRSELHGFIRRVEDLGLELVSVVEVAEE
jgi:hypothetical protein